MLENTCLENTCFSSNEVGVESSLGSDGNRSPSGTLKLVCLRRENKPTRMMLLRTEVPLFQLFDEFRQLLNGIFASKYVFYHSRLGKTEA